MGITRSKSMAAAVAAALSLPGCGGGGGGGGALRPDGGSDTGVAVTPGVYGTPANRHGAGVVVAVLDSGVRASHDEFGNGARVLAGHNVADGNSDVADQDAGSHGTRVASVAVGATLGVATGATLLPVRIIGRSGSFTTSDIAAGMDYARSEGAPVHNISASVYDTYSIRSAAEASAAAGLLTVAAAGNGGNDDPIPAPLLNNISPEAVAHFLVVGAVDGNDQITYWSDRAGSAKHRYLVARGTAVPTALNTGDDQYGSASGTSFSSPQVAGAAALVKGADPALSMRDVADILLRSADDLGAPGVDPVYGWGKLNPERALQPIGTLAIPEAERAGGSARPVSATTLRLGRAFGDGLRHAGAALSRVLALDEYRRPYRVDAAGAVNVAQRAVDVAGAHTSLLREQGAIDAQWGGLQFTGRWQSDRRQWSGDWMAGDAAEAAVYGRALALSGETAGMTWTWSHGAAPAARFGAAALEPVQRLPWLFGDGPQDSYLALVDSDVEGLSISSARVGGMEWRLGFFDGRNAEAFEQGEVQAGIAETAYDAGPLQLRFSASQVHEYGGILNSAGGGAFATGQRALTDSVGIAGQWRLTPQTTLLGHYQAGRTRVQGDAGGLLRHWSTLYSDAWGVGAVHQGLWREDDYLGLSWRRPLRVNRGSVDVDAPVARDLDYNVLRQRQRIDVMPSGAEHNLELVYGFGLRHGGEFSAGLIYRTEPGHVRDAEPDLGVLFGVRRPF